MNSTDTHAPHTVQYSTVTGEEDGVTPHSTLCGVRGLDLLSVTNVKNVTGRRGKKGRRGPAWVWGSD